MTSVDEAARAVLHFWFDEIGEDRWFARDDKLDAEIARRFGALRREVIETKAAGWRETAATMTAAIILTDQFSRNMFRRSARAFEADPLALELALEALDKGTGHTASTIWKAFLLMPLMHSEDSAVQDRSVAEFRKLGQELNVNFAQKHRDQIVRFGRFPGRNQALGRVSSGEEREAIASGETF